MRRASRCPTSRSGRRELVGAFPDRDLAVLRIDAPREKLKPVALGTSRDLQVGQKVFAIGNPFGLDQTLTTGIISALDREIESVNERTIRGVIQTDAAINPGNSGGPLLDSAGRLIGVNTAIFSPSGASAGIGFAIPVDEVNRIVPRLIRDGVIHAARARHPGRLPADPRSALGVPRAWPCGRRAREPGRSGGPAAVPPRPRGEIIAGDIVDGRAGKPVASLDDLLDVLERHSRAKRSR